MNMNFEKLLVDGKIERIERDENPDFSRCDSDIQFARKALKENTEWAASIAYAAVIRAATKLLTYFGYRAIGKEHHKNIFGCVKEIAIDSDLTQFFDHVRRKRNDFLYRDAVHFSESESEEITHKAEEFVHKIRTFVRKNRTIGKAA